DRKGVRWTADLQRWLAPFFMAMVNTRVVRRSAMLFAQGGSPYGPHFAYREFMAMRSPLRASMLAAGIVGAQLALASPLRALVKRRLPPPGTGPSEEGRRNGGVRLDLAAHCEGRRRALPPAEDHGAPRD